MKRTALLLILAGLLAFVLQIVPFILEYMEDERIPMNTRKVVR